MLKIVVFDSGFGGELFADRLEDELPVVEVIRVIDWRHAAELQSNPRKARKYAEIALRPYLGKVDLIIFANHFLSATSLKYFRRHYKTQKFLGLGLKTPETFVKRDVLILTTKPLARTVNFYNYLFHLKRNSRTLHLDDWPGKIDDGELSFDEIQNVLNPVTQKDNFSPAEVILLCSQFNDIKSELHRIFGHNLKIYDSFDDTVRQIYKTLRIRGCAKRK